MHPTDVKSKLPERAILLLLIIMCLADICDCANDACYGTVWKVRVQNYRLSKGQGYVRVSNRKQVIARPDTVMHHLYKISSDDVGFYLYDPRAKKFLCWTETWDRVIGMNTRKINKLNKLTKTNPWSRCKFKDYPSNRTGYLRLQALKHSSSEMIFGGNGQQFKGNCKKKRHNHCHKYGDFLLVTDSWEANTCTYNTFCKGDLASMPELSVICRRWHKNDTIKN